MNDACQTLLETRVLVTGRNTIRVTEIMSLSALLSFPDCLLRELLTKWLKLKDVGQLDSAVCSTEARPAFLSWAFGANNVFDSKPLGERGCYHDILLRWSFLRSAKFDGFYVTAKLVIDCELQDQILANIGPTTRWITLVDCGKDVKQVSNFFENLARWCGGTEELSIRWSAPRGQ